MPDGDLTALLGAGWSADHRHDDQGKSEEGHTDHYRPRRDEYEPLEDVRGRYVDLEDVRGLDGPL